MYTYAAIINAKGSDSETLKTWLWEQKEFKTNKVVKNLSIFSALQIK